MAKKTTSFVHLLKERDGSSVKARCGWTETMVGPESIYPTFTGWAAKVTCPQCLAEAANKSWR